MSYFKPNAYQTNTKTKFFIMKNILFLSFLMTVNALGAIAQQAELIGIWQLFKVEVKDQTHEGLKAIYIFEKNGELRAARSLESSVISAGTWKFNKRQQAIIMSSTLDKDFNGKATLVKISDAEMVYKKEDAVLYFQKIPSPDLPSKVEDPKPALNITRLEFSEEEFFTEDGDYKYYDDEAKLPWKDYMEMLMSLNNVTQLIYKFSTLEDDGANFNTTILKADVNSNPSEQTLSIDYIFYGYDRYNLPDDSALPPNTEYSNLLYPEEENTFRVTGSEQITTQAGTFECTVIEVIGSLETKKKLWMINEKPGIYAKIITDKPGSFGKYTIFELQEIKMLE